jgi:hypothetical protein
MSNRSTTRHCPQCGSDVATDEWGTDDAVHNGVLFCGADCLAGYKAQDYKQKLFEDLWCDGDGMPWLTLTPWARKGDSLLMECGLRAESRVRASEAGVYRVNAPALALSVTVQWDVECGATSVTIAIEGSSHGAGLSAPSPVTMRLMLARLGEGKPPSWWCESTIDTERTTRLSWFEGAQLAEVLVGTIHADDCESFHAAADELSRAMASKSKGVAA